MEDAVNALRLEHFPHLNDDKIRLVHKVLLPDFELREVSQSLKIVLDAVQDASKLTSSQLLKLLQKNDVDYRPTCIALARIVATMPHSMDVERIISSYNLIKTTDRSSLSSDTLKDYLAVCHNMPCVAQFDVQPTVEEWNKRVQRKPRQSRDIAKFMCQEYVAAFFGTSHNNKSIDAPKHLKCFIVFVYDFDYFTIFLKMWEWSVIIFSKFRH